MQLGMIVSTMTRLNHAAKNLQSNRISFKNNAPNRQQWEMFTVHLMFKLSSSCNHRSSKSLLLLANDFVDDALIQLIPPLCLSSRLLACESLRWGVCHMGSSSPVISITNVHWCEVQADEILRYGVYSLLPLPSTIPTSIYTLASRIRLTQWSSARLWTCPYHLSLDSRIFSVMQETPTAWLFPFVAYTQCVIVSCGPPSFWSCTPILVVQLLVATRLRTSIGIGAGTIFRLVEQKLNQFSVGGAKIGEKQSSQSNSKYKFMQYVYFSKKMYVRNVQRCLGQSPRSWTSRDFLC